MALRLDKSELERLEARGFKVEARIGASEGLGLTQLAGMGKERPKPAEALQSRPRHKYHAQADQRGDRKFGSKAEARYFDHLETLKQGKALLFFLSQVPFHVPGGRYVVDFVEFWPDGSITWTDVKGYETSEFRFKRRAVEACYPVKIRTTRPGTGTNKGTWVYNETA